MKRKKTSKEPGDLAKLVGQLLVIGFDGTEMSPAVASLLTRIQPAGEFYLAVISWVPHRRTSYLKRAKTASPHRYLLVWISKAAAWIAFERFSGELLPRLTSSPTGRRPLFRKHGKLIGQCCRTLGFNTDFAPVVDLALEASRTVMSSRVVSADPKQVVVYAREFLAGLKSAGIIGCIKHFPGLGEANLDTHEDLPSVNKPFKKLWAEDIYPYRALRRDAPMVLVGHVNHPQATKNTAPASLSKKWITDVLRKRVGYRGLIVSDDLEMGGVLKAAPIERAAEKFIGAGATFA